MKASQLRDNTVKNILVALLVATKPPKEPCHFRFYGLFDAGLEAETESTIAITGNCL